MVRIESCTKSDEYWVYFKQPLYRQECVVDSYTNLCHLIYLIFHLICLNIFTLFLFLIIIFSLLYFIFSYLKYSINLSILNFLISTSNHQMRQMTIREEYANYRRHECTCWLRSFFLLAFFFYIKHLIYYHLSSPS